MAFDDSGPILSPADGPPGTRYVQPAAATRARDGRYVLVVVWFGDERSGERPRVAVATSSDARAWTVGKTPIFTDLGVGTARPGPGPIPTTVLQLDDGSWLLYGWAAEADDPRSFATWRASAPALEGPWALDRGGVLAPGAFGAWDSQTAAIGSVQRGDGGYRAWYEGQPPGSMVRGSLGFATSSDGLSWQKYDDPTTTADDTAASDPVIRPGICGAMTARAVFQPRVQPSPDGYRMVFGAYDTIGEHMDLFGALSMDGIHWTCATPKPLLQYDAIPGTEGIHTLTSFPLADGGIGVPIESLEDGTSEVWLGTVRAVD